MFPLPENTLKWFIQNHVICSRSCHGRVNRAHQVAPRRFVDGLVAGLPERHARLLLLVIGRQCVDPLVLLADFEDPRFGTLLRNGQGGDRRAELGGIVVRRVQLCIEEFLAPERAVRRDDAAVDAEGHAAEPSQVGARERRRPCRQGAAGRGRDQRDEQAASHQEQMPHV